MYLAPVTISTFKIIKNNKTSNYKKKLNIIKTNILQLLHIIIKTLFTIITITILFILFFLNLIFNYS